MKKAFALLIFLLSMPMIAQEIVDLSGVWEFEIDRENLLQADSRYHDKIALPGSMPQRLKGYLPSVRTKWTGALYDSSYFHNPYMKKYQSEDNFSVPFFLTPVRHYVGTAWYRRVVSVPRSMQNKHITLYLERPHITTTLYINGTKVGSQNSLSVAHEYDVTSYLRPGKSNTIAISVNNEIESVGVGHDSHSVTDQTQGNWNGIVGRMELRAVPLLRIDEVQVFPYIKDNTLSVKVAVSKDASVPSSLKYRIESTDNTFSHTGSLQMKGKVDTLTVCIPAQKPVKYWDEFSPNTYQLVVRVQGDNMPEDVRTLTFGMREIETRGKDFYVNGRQTIMRGTVENCDFPNTGYPPTDYTSWYGVLLKCKQYGLNHVRFHSYCPPEAAFQAADNLGIYLQPEGPSWPNHGVKLGQGQIIDTYLMEETQKMVRLYGNHPSFCMLSAGNEPAGNWVPWVSRFVDYWRSVDARRIYTGASVGGGWAWQPHNQYHVKAGARGLDSWRRSIPESMYDFREKIDTVSQPFISHETGQWCVFPDLSESAQYTGVNQPRNFDIFRDILRDNGMEHMARPFLMASGKLQVLCYKAEIERTLRTPGYDGFQLLGLNDYSGQGSAIVGPLNVFFREKGYVDSVEWREFCSPVTLLCRLPRFTYWSGETIPYSIDISNFGNAEFRNGQLLVECRDDSGTMVYDKHYSIPGEFPIGLIEEVLTDSFSLTITEATHLTFRATLKTANLSTTNHWDMWLYPQSTLEYVASQSTPDDIYITPTLDEQAKEALARGGKVLITAAGRITYGADIQQQFTPVFWNTSWFKMRPPHTTGIYVRHEHPLFRHFPTSYHSDMQWWELVNRQQVMLMDKLPSEVEPLIQSIDTWFLSRKIGMLIEAKVGSGRLIITTLPIEQKQWLDHPVAAQMRRAILQYMQSQDFAPKATISPESLEELFSLPTPPVNMFTNDSPDELKPKLK